MRINHNIASLNTYRQLTMNNTNGAKSLEKLSSGYRINRAGDDAAGLAISEKMRAQIRGLDMASKNSQDAISLVQTAEGALSETQSILQRMRELAVQSANDTNVTVDRQQIQKEINQLTTEINRIGGATEFNTMKLLNGDLAKTAGTDAGDTETVLNAGTKTINYATNVAAGADSDLAAALGNITVAAGDLVDSILSETSTIKVTRDATGFTVEILGESANGTAFTSSDGVTADANGDFVYAEHGVSFTIKAADVADISIGSTLTIENFTGAGTYGTQSDYVISAASASATLGPISVVANDMNKNIRSMSFSAASAGTSVTITFGEAYSGGNTVHEDVISISTGSTALNFNSYGITFTLDVGGMSAGATVSGSISFEDLGTTTNVLKYIDHSLQFQVGANKDQTLSLAVSDMRASALLVSSSTGGTGFTSTKSVTDGTSSVESEYSLDVSSASAAASAIEVYNTAITSVSEERAKLGSVQNRLEHTINNLDVTAENLQASESRIRDVDMAKEMMEFTKNNILMQAAQAMLAQANQQPQGVLQLLR
jgi:flagellin